MTAKQLTDSILLLAIQGKLIPQDPNDEPASELLERIREEKRRLVNEGKLKKKDLEETPVDEVPYNIPENWAWLRLENITIYISRGKSPVYSETKKYPVIAQKCNQWSGFSLEKAKFIDPKTVDKYAEERILQDGDLLWNSTGLGTLGRMAIYDSSVNEYGWAVADSHVTVIRTRPDFAFYKFLYYYFASPEVQRVIEDKSDGSTKQKELAQETVKKYEIPLPPLAEQHRIVERIEELLPFVKEYGEAYEEASKMDAELPDKLKKSILQEAIMGKLGTQDPQDEPASVLLEQIREEKKRLVKEGVLKKKDLEEIPVTEDEEPFKIPESWEWCRHNFLFDISGGSQPPKSLFSPINKEGYIRLYQIRDYGKKPQPVYIPIAKASKITQKGDILLARYGGSLGKVFLAEEGAYNVAMAKVDYLFNKGTIDHKYLFFYYHCSLYQDLLKGNSNRSAQGGFNKEDLNNLFFPLPPLAEQHRIVEKIEALYAEIDNMKINKIINEKDIEETEE